MKTTALAEAVVTAFSAIIEAMPAHSQERVAAILSLALAGDTIVDPEARAVVKCLACHPEDQLH